MSPLKKNHLPFLLIAFSAVISVLYTACNSEGQPHSATLTEPGKPATFSLNCVILDRNQIQQWVDNGWTNPKKPDSLITKILLQFMSTDAQGAATNMQLMTYPAKSYTEVYVSGGQVAAIDTSCQVMFPTGKIMLGNNYADISRLGILNADGTLKDFLYVRFVPVQDKTGAYITFMTELVKSDSAKMMNVVDTTGFSEPCPTICQ